MADDTRTWEKAPERDADRARDQERAQNHAVKRRIEHEEKRVEHKKSRHRTH